MDIRNVLEKLKPVLIIIALFALAFYIRAEAVNLGESPLMARTSTPVLMVCPTSVRWTPTTTTGSP